MIHFTRIIGNFLKDGQIRHWLLSVLRFPTYPLNFQFSISFKIFYRFIRKIRYYIIYQQTIRLRWMEMKLTNEELEVLSILEENHRVSVETMAAMVNTTVENTMEIIKKLESDKIIVSYPALIDWSKVEGKENIVAMIEVKVTPKRGVGFDEVAERIYRFPEVTSLYLMSGAYDLSLTIEGKSMTEIATFVSEKLSTIENVISTTTHFMLKKYKHDGVVFGGSKDTDRRMVVSP